MACGVWGKGLDGEDLRDKGIAAEGGGAGCLSKAWSGVTVVPVTVVFWGRKGMEQSL